MTIETSSSEGKVQINMRLRREFMTCSNGSKIAHWASLIVLVKMPSYLEEHEIKTNMYGKLMRNIYENVTQRKGFAVNIYQGKP